ncbi:MAG TPA: lipoprotein signal peptidase [Chitinophagales bacterium]|nr:lipoprotein signal peptidase [Chitinophagales bacterium]
MKPYKVFLIIAGILMMDQGLKFWVKTHMMLGDEIVITNWFRIHFTENPGMAFGMVIPGVAGKLFLSFFRMAAAIGGSWYVYRLVKQKAHWGFITACAMILAGAIGNMLDGLFYGLVFTDSFGKVAEVFPKGGGYAGFLQGQVVDMLWFPLAHGFFPGWVPVWGGEYYEFFRPVFNIADSAITVGVFAIIAFQHYFFREEIQAEVPVESQALETEVDTKGNA